MSLGHQLRQLPPDAFRTVESMYGAHFPLKAREFMAYHIEDTLYQLSNVSNYKSIVGSMDDFIQEFDDKIEDQALSKEEKGKLKTTLKDLRRRHQDNPLAIFKFLHYCVSVEQSLLLTHFCGNAPRILHDPVWEDIGSIVQEFTSLTGNTEDSRKMVEWLVTWTEAATRQATVTAHELVAYKIGVLQGIKVNLPRLHELQRKFLEEKLNPWKCQQQGADTGTYNEGLNVLKLWFGDLADLIVNYRHQLMALQGIEQNFERYTGQPLFSEEWLRIWNDLRNDLSTLVKMSFVVELQPPQVIIKETHKFDVTIKSLLGDRSYVQSFSSTVTASIVPVVASDEVLNGCELSANETVWKYSESSAPTPAHFKKLSVKTIIRKAQKDKVDKVTSQKVYIMFSASMQADGEVIPVTAPSLPIVVTVHRSQDSDAWGTIAWDDAFRGLNRFPYNVEENISWSSISAAMNRFFTRETGRPLTERNLEFLCEKFFTAFPLELSEAQSSWNALLVNRLQLCRTPLTTNGTPQAFTFWDWFYAIMKLTKDHLSKPWRDGLIEGFISKAGARELLYPCPDNTFILRFTESMEPKVSSNQHWKGSISITWIETDIYGERTVQSLHPFSSNDLEARNLSAWIKASDSKAKFLYPNIPVAEVFNLSERPAINGYVRPEVKLIVDPRNEQTIKDMESRSRTIPSFIAAFLTKLH